MSMKKIIVLGALALMSTIAFADTPVGPMNYQGRLLDSAGIPVTNTYDFIVRVYDAATAGTLKYQETHSGVAIDDGVYSFLVGTKPKDAGDSTWSVELWNCCTSLYLEISVNGQTLTPRHLLAAAPFAFQANLALTTNNALALGGKSAGNVMQDICKSGKGKWLNLVQKCLGVGSSFPGPTRVNWSTLSSDNNFTGIDLTNADVSGIDFSGAYLGSTIFKQTIYSVQGLVGVLSLSSSRWDGAIATDTTPASLVGLELEDMHLLNMNLSKWNLTQAQILTGFSAGSLVSCPTGLPNDWNCKLNLGAYGGYYLIGPYGDLSTGSVHVSSYDNSIDTRLDLDNTNLTGTNFYGDLITQTFTNSNLNGSGMYKCHMTSPTLDATVDNAYMHSCHIEKTIFTKAILGTSMDETHLEYVKFNNNLNYVSFRGATLRNVIFAGLVNNCDFTNAILDNVSFAGGTGNISTGVRLFSGSPMPPP